MSNSRRSYPDENSACALAMRELLDEEFGAPDASREGASEASHPSVAEWRKLRAAGTELWLDTGDIATAQSLWCSEFSALTTNNTLLNKEVQKGIYDALVPRIAARLREAAPDLDEKTLVLELAFALNAAHGLELVRRFSTRVSVELHTDLAHDVEASVMYGRRFRDVCPDHFIVKVPLTAEGLVAARRLGEEGIPVNFTLGFSARQNFLTCSVAKPAYCNVFMGRINAFVSSAKLGSGENAGERATASSQAGVAHLRDAGICSTLQIGASMRGAAQVAALAGLDVYTMPPAVARGALDEGLLDAELTALDESAFPVTFATGVDPARERLDAFWRIDERAKAAAATLAETPLRELDTARVKGVLDAKGCTDLLPELTDEELARVAAEGKIPSFDTWHADVGAGRFAWDGLLTVAGLASFGEDQAALDERIRAQLDRD